MSYFCVKVVMNSGDSWILDETYGGIGCSPTDSGLNHLGLWAPAKYTLINATQVVDNIPINMSAVPICLFSGNDPIMFGFNITNGTLNFDNIDVSFQYD